jgi:signal transduction histidine kinase/ligand-binding sensor domain-containing protein/DNA-binding response OmpR family regulator
MYNYKREAYESFPLEFNAEVVAMALVGNNLWIGSTVGLFRYNFKDNTLEEIMLGKDSTQHIELVYSVIEDEGDIYVGTFKGFGKYSLSDKQFEYINLASLGIGEMVFVNSLLKDEKRKCIWVGTGGLLIKYTPYTNKLESKGLFSVVKSMGLDRNNNLVIGTDNGLFIIYNETTVEYVQHDSRDLKSLSNNIVWAVYTDSNQNIWLGTDYGISMSPGNRSFEFIPIHQLTGSREGNHFYSIYKDSSGYYWLGGTNGLIRTNNLAPGTVSKWYMMNHINSYITHNHIRDIFEDKDNNLWVATDMGINRYDYKTERFISYHITDTSGIYTSTWGYHLLEDHSANLWIATCMSGILVINKKTLKNTNPTTCIADKCFSISSGLSGNFINHIVLDKKDNIWALVNNISIDKIQTVDDKIIHIPILEYTEGAKPRLIMCDSEGYIWVGFRGGVAKIHAETLQTETITFSSNNIELLSMIEVDHTIWVSSTNGIWIIDRKKLTTHHQNIMNRAFTSLYYDKEWKRVYMGTIDGLSLTQLPVVYNNKNDSPIIITALYVNDMALPTQSYQGTSIRYLDYIRLKHNQNTFTLEFSDFNFSRESRSIFIYKLNRTDDVWHTLKVNENIVSFSNLKSGKYSLLISRWGVNGRPSDIVKTFEIEIMHPWYLTTFAKCIYIVILIAMMLWTIYFFKVRNQLRFERLEKAKTLEQSRLKIDFFTEISHELKTPLSLIIAPLSQLLLETKRNPSEKKTLNLIYQNAMKLNSLIHQAIEFYRNDSKTHLGLITSHIEFVEFARTLFSTYTESMKDKQIAFIFSSNLNTIYLNIDVIKIESVLNNLLTNACKYTNKGDSIMLTLDYSPQNEVLEIRVSDTGIGISQQDVLYVFQRFFQSSINSQNKDGTGLGLYLVKKFVELHGGTIYVESNKESGTSFIIRLPIESSVESEKNISETEHVLDEGMNKPLIVIVEDNTDIAAFIYNIFVPEYRCVIAHNGKVGLKLSMELLPDLMIADIIMPVMDGLEMCHRLKSHVPTSTIPIILLTAKDDITTELNSINLHVDVFIPKPFNQSVLYSRAKQLIASKSQLEKKVRIEILSEPKMEAEVSYAEKLLANITQVIEENISDSNFNVNMLCKIVGVSQKQLYRKIKQLTGMTTIEYIKSIKLKKAAILLSSKKFTVSEVMYMVGFSNHSYFAKCFFAQFGKTPNQYNELSCTKIALLNNHP